MEKKLDKYYKENTKPIVDKFYQILENDDIDEIEKFLSTKSNMQFLPNVYDLSENDAKLLYSSIKSYDMLFVLVSEEIVFVDELQILLYNDNWKNIIDDCIKNAESRGGQPQYILLELFIDSENNRKIRQSTNGHEKIKYIFDKWSSITKRELQVKDFITINGIYLPE